MNRKQNVIILNLILVTVIVLIYLMLYKPLISNIKIAKEDLEMVQLDYDSKQRKIETLNTVEKMLDDIGKDAEDLIPRFYGDISQEELIVKINDLCMASEVRLLEISYDGTKEFILETAFAEETNGTSEANDTEEVETGETILHGEAFKVRFAGTYEKILKMLNLIDNNDKTIVNMGLEINREIDFTSNIPEELKSAYPNVDFEALLHEDGELTCQFDLVFFQADGLEVLNLPDYNILKEKPREKSTGGNPFAIYIDEALEKYREQ